MFGLLGMEISGDLGDYTLWRTRRGKIVCYPRTVPGKPPSPPQQAHRLHFAESVRRWHQLTPQQKADYERMANASSLCMTGHNLWIRWTFAGSRAEAETLMRTAGVSVPLPPELQ